MLGSEHNDPFYMGKDGQVCDPESLHPGLPLAIVLILPTSISPEGSDPDQPVWRRPGRYLQRRGHFHPGGIQADINDRRQAADGDPRGLRDGAEGAGAA